MGHFKQRFVERRDLIVGGGFEILPSNRPRTEQLGAAVQPGQPVENAYDEKRKT
jgi:hypothetical protein